MNKKQTKKVENPTKNLTDEQLKLRAYEEYLVIDKASSVIQQHQQLIQRASRNVEVINAELESREAKKKLPKQEEKPHSKSEERRVASLKANTKNGAKKK